MEYLVQGTLTTLSSGCANIYFGNGSNPCGGGTGTFNICTGCLHVTQPPPECHINCPGHTGCLPSFNGGWIPHGN